jgi:tRNA (cytidine/uridine-2'-O-)-methyltransferase
MTSSHRDYDLHVVLVEPEIHWNTGNAGRTVLAAGAMLHLVEPLGFSLDARQVRRAGLDYWARVPVKLWPNWPALERELSLIGEPFFISPEAEQTIWDARFPARAVLIFGSETGGFTESLREQHRERFFSIPMKDQTLRSLNLSTAVGITLYEVLRQQRNS